MGLKEKISYCRKKSGLSQEALAEQIGVSRQAISKWETGDAVPEINKLLLLANVFGVTTDWLLKDDEREYEKEESQGTRSESTVAAATWVDAVPGVIGKLLRRYGWLAGVYLAVMGALITGMGVLARVAVNRMSSALVSAQVAEDSLVLDQFGMKTNNTFSNMAANNPVSIMGAFFIILGIVMLISGIIIAVVLKKHSKEQGK